MDTNDKLISAHDRMADTEAITIDSLANVDMARIVALIENDVFTGEMSVGQRKSAHLLLKYYAPQKASHPQSNQQVSTLDSIPTASILHMIKLIDDRILDPSDHVSTASAGTDDIDLVLSDPSKKNLISSNTNRSPSKKNRISNIISESQESSDTSLFEANKRAGKML